MAVLATLDRTEDAATSFGSPVVPRRGGWSTGKLSYADFERQAVEFARAAALASQVRAGAVDSRCSAGAAAPGQRGWPGVANKGLSPWRLLATRARLSPSDAVFSRAHASPPLSSRGGSRGSGSGPRLGMSASPQAEEAISVSSTCNGARAPPPVTSQRQALRPRPIWRSLWRSRTQERCRPAGGTMRCTSMNTTWSKSATPRPPPPARMLVHLAASAGCGRPTQAMRGKLHSGPAGEIEMFRLLIFCDRFTARHTACSCCTCEVARQAGQCWRPRRFGKTCVLPTVGLRPISKPPTGSPILYVLIRTTSTSSSVCCPLAPTTKCLVVTVRLRSRLLRRAATCCIMLQEDA
jgi:hypothetical protein